MRGCRAPWIAGVVLWGVAPSAVVLAQGVGEPAVPDRLKTLREQVKAMHALDALQSTDPQTIRELILAELAWSAAFLGEYKPEDSGYMTLVSQGYKAFLGRIRSEFQDESNKDAFRNALTAQLVALATERLPAADLTLLDGMNLTGALGIVTKLETVPALKAGLQSKLASVRFECAVLLRALQAEIVAANQFPEVVTALRTAAIVEQNEPTRARLLHALAAPGQIAAVFDALMAVLDARLEALRKESAAVGTDYIVALNYLQSEAERLNPQQSEAIVRRLAVLLRFAAAQYAAPGERSFEEEYNLEQTLSQTEALLTRLTQQNGQVRKAIDEKSEDVRQKVLEAGIAWYGSSDRQGVLNGDPWRVEAGAP